jgi:uncharacterized membrane protein YebE (DUF533 family)
MVDARSLIDLLVNGAGPQPSARSPSSGGLGDILAQVLGKSSSPGGTAGGPGSGGLEDLLRNMLPSAPSAGSSTSASSSTTAPAAPSGGLEDILRRLGGSDAPVARAAPADDNEPAPSASAPSGSDTGGGLGDILRKLGGPGGSTGDIGDLLKQVLGQATTGVREGAEQIGQSTGLGDAIKNATGGKSADDLLAQLKELVNNNQLGAGATLGGLGALILGTKTGRGLAASTAKLGGLVLISGLAYKAWQNYQSGKPALGGPTTLAAAPPGSGFEAQAVSNDQASLLLRAMIAAAASDGRIDQSEHDKLLGGLKQAGLDAEAESFLRQELRSPASIDDLASSVSTPEAAAQLYTAARVAIEPDTDEEVEFLVSLANRLGMEQGLVDHIEATARGVGMRQ